MMSNQLFIIGNGFDLWHKLPTGYREFYKENSDYLDQIEHYFSDGLQEEELWSDFESVLGQFDESILIDENDFMDFSGDSFPTQQLYGLEDAVDEFSHEIVDNITRCFREWIKGINIDNAVLQMTFPDESRFINFNYTSTLQVAYKVSERKVYHIHGSLEQRTPLIFGHTKTVFNATADEDSYYTEAINNGRSVLTALQKPVNEIIEDRLSPWIKNNGDISMITIIGHSLNKIDIPYFQRIVNELPNVHWQCYSFNEEESINHAEILNSIGIPTSRLFCGTYDDLVQHYPHLECTA
ncbi:hypothetical protein ERW49_14280 [Aliivibrio finisterrensis]|uniref:Bacteriophage abortive infection AbiH family protein n=1 Tax=Aliivibrio finisterrensis TaxID=511998 RepID=A0A4Q5KH55_9GAMM|nr:MULTISPECIES: bacteriophage abortive infection AbiH family protein [Aliivibrio]MDD9174414.1 bacteriophage abortive infection AbiH family protein [Aliivibrio sp. S3TY1]MDD9191492.1 bacteriophage abortive infection AbiH family protein [Aliivibrio sp. S2TY2]RYU45472.1 hypothetical protein ERW49_14280 [Aliivibrio finisterrensis]